MLRIDIKTSKLLRTIKLSLLSDRCNKCLTNQHQFMNHQAKTSKRHLKITTKMEICQLTNSWTNQGNLMTKFSRGDSRMHTREHLMGIQMRLGRTLTLGRVHQLLLRDLNLKGSHLQRRS
jgi:hypothetical protein